MGLRFVEYRRRQWVLRYRDPWSGKQRIKSFSTEGEAAHVLGFGDKGHGRGAP